MRAIFTQIRAAVLRHRTQTATILLLSMLAAGVLTLALTLLVRSTQPFDDAFARVSGPHLVFHLDASRVTPTQLEATASLPGVTAAGPPHEIALVPLQRGEEKAVFDVVERASPGGALDRLILRDGRWPQRPGEIAVSYRGDLPGLNRLSVGAAVQAVTSHGLPSFTVVGTVYDIADGLFENNVGVARAWVLPGQVAALADGDQVRLGYEMAYRFKQAATSEELIADRQLVETALPPAVESWKVTDWLTRRIASIWFITFMSSAIFAFAVFALLAVAMIVASVVAGAVVSGYREIGMLKALGFTPRAVVGVVIGQMELPALTGAVVGVPAGALASRPLLSDAATGAGLPDPSFIDPMLDLSILLGVLVLVALAAFVPALRAASTNTVQAIALGASPSAQRRSRLAALLAHTRVPRPFTLGASEAFARPARAMLTLIALAIGVATMTFAAGFQKTIGDLSKNSASYGFAQDVEVYRYPAYSDAALTSLLDRQPETDVVVATRLLHVAVPGAADPQPLIAMRGDAPALGYRASTGRWFAAPGEAVVASLTARDAHLRVGDRIAVGLEGKALTLTVVGIIDDLALSGHGFRTESATVTAALPDAAPNDYLVKLRAGSDAKAFAHRIAATSLDALTVTPTPLDQVAFYLALTRGTIGGLTLVLALVAAASVFNATLLNTRERLHDIATLKAVGMTTMQIALMVSASALVLAIAAALIGFPAGIWMTGAVFGAMFQFMGLLVDAGGSFGPLTLLTVAAATLVVALAGTALPARWAAATPVAEVLRSE